MVDSEVLGGVYGSQRVTPPFAARLFCQVSYYYSQMRPLLTEITNARTATASQAAAEHVVEQVLELMDPLFVSMVKAVPWKATLQKPRRRRSSGPRRGGSALGKTLAVEGDMNQDFPQRLKYAISNGRIWPSKSKMAMLAVGPCGGGSQKNC